MLRVEYGANEIMMRMKIEMVGERNIAFLLSVRFIWREEMEMRSFGSVDFLLVLKWAQNV